MGDLLPCPFDMLAERCEKATGPDAELDARIQAALNGDDWEAMRRDGYAPRDWNAPTFTKSLDAAMTLVPEGAGINLERYWTREREEWAAILIYGIAGRGVRIEAATAALALSAAALKAKANV